MIFFLYIHFLLIFSPPTPRRSAPDVREQRVRQMMDQLSRILSASSQPKSDNGSNTLPLSLQFQHKGTGDSLKSIYYQPYSKGGKPQIVVMEELVTYCETYGSRSRDALACLMGHEMAHHYHHHGQPGVQFATLATPVAKSSGDRVNLEAIADQSGVFAAYFSGYDAFTVAPRIYADVYDLFLHKREPPGYLPRKQRLQMIADTTMRVRELAHWCELTEFFYLQRDYSSAYATLSEVFSRYPAPIIHNNLGVVKLNHAIALMGTVDDNPLLRFAFPVEYDTDNRLLNNKRRGKKEEYKKLLAEAHRLFKGALKIQPQYEAAQINLSIVELLSSEPNHTDQARAVLQPMLNTSGQRPANAVLMMAITESAAGNSLSAFQLFNEAKRLGAYRGAHNENMAKPKWARRLERLLSPPAQSVSNQKKRQPQPPANWNLGKATEALGKPGGFPAQYTRTDNMTRYEVSSFVNNDSKPYCIGRSTVQPLPGLPIGSSRQMLSARFAPPMREVAGARQTVWLGYGTLQSGLWLEYRADELVGWLAYEQGR
jgi:tetratricopeptide (TPR) repeat protein